MSDREYVEREYKLASVGQLYGRTLLHAKVPRNQAEKPGGPQYLTKEERAQHASTLAAEIEARGKIGKAARYEWWQLEYYKYMYLSDCTADEFVDVWDSVWENLLVLGPEHKIRPDMEAHNGEEAYWMRRFTHLLVESQFRGGNPAIVPREAPQLLGEKMLRPIVNVPVPHWDRHWIFKFGAVEHMVSARENEVIRFAPAASYADPSLNGAQRDFEGQASWMVPGSSLPHGAFRTEAGEPIPLAIGNFTVTHSSATPFFVWCAAGRYRPEIANAFEAEAVLVIRDRRRFQRDLYKAIAKAGHEVSLLNDVVYFDPFQAPIQNVPLHFLKHHRFMYQKEFRAAIAMPLKSAPTEPFFIEVPGVKKYCHVAKLRDASSVSV